MQYLVSYISIQSYIIIIMVLFYLFIQYYADPILYSNNTSS